MSIWTGKIIKKKLSNFFVLLVWKLRLTSRSNVLEYSTALHYIHNLGGIHGDPHLGNILVTQSTPMTPSLKPDCDQQPLQAKIADAGTSEFWSSHSKIEEREASLILETAGRLFREENFSRLWLHPHGLDYQDTLAILQAPVNYLKRVYGLVDWDARGLNANILAELIFQNPFFDIKVALAQVEQTGITTADRLARRLNARLQNIHDFMEAHEEVDQQTLDLYIEHAHQFLFLKKKAALQRETGEV